MIDPLSIHIVDDGPIKIAGEGIRLRYCGEPVDIGEKRSVFLCRCGQSSNAPFCDGTHNAISFEADPAEGPTRPTKVWEGKTIRTRFNPNACMHVFHCKPLKALRERELQGDAEAAAEIARVVEACPSGALTWEATEGDLDVDVPSGDVDVDVIEGGEIRLSRRFEINCELQEGQPDTRATLCRCGLSNNKPWCDGRHRKREDFR